MNLIEINLEPSVACPETGETKIGCVYEMVER
jgi:hypothetical protein